MRVEANIPGGVDAFVVDLHGQKWVSTSYFPADLVDTLRLPSSGKRRTYLRFCVLLDMRTMPPIDWQAIESWIQSQRQKQRKGSSKLLKRCSSRVCTHSC